jgi:hypothetical protein
LLKVKELGPNAWTLAQKLANEDNRLVVTALTVSGRETAEVVHEALIRNWPSLVKWVNDDRGFIAWRNQLKQRLDEWRDNPTDQGALLRGGPLSVAEEWVTQRGVELNEEESLFISASTRLRSEEKVQRNRDQFQSIALFSLILIIGILVPFSLYLTNRMPSFPQFSDIKVITETTSFLTTLFVQIVSFCVNFVLLITPKRVKSILRGVSFLILSQIILLCFVLQINEASPSMSSWFRATVVNIFPRWEDGVGVNTISLITCLLSTSLIFMIGLLRIRWMNIWLFLFLSSYWCRVFSNYMNSPGAYFRNDSERLINNYGLWLMCFSSFGGLVGIASALQFQTMLRRNQFKAGS